MLDLIFGHYGTSIGGEHIGEYPQFLIDRGPQAVALVPRLTDVLSKPPAIERQEWLRLGLARFSARMLGSIGPEAKPAAFALEEVAMNYDRFGNSTSADDIEGTRTMALRALRMIGVECEAFERLLDSRYDTTRLDAFLVLELQCPERLVSRIKDLLVDPSPQLRLRALAFANEHDIGDDKKSRTEATSDEN